MNINDWVVLVTALGGIEGIKQLLKWWMSRKTEARKEDASADAVEDENERKQVDWLEKRITQRDAKIDCIYTELRNEQSDKLSWIHKCHELELQLKDAEYNRCDRPDSDCSRRIPPRRNNLINKEEKK